MGSNYRARERCCVLDDCEDDEPPPNTICGKVAYYLGRLRRRLPDYIPYIIIGIVAVLVAFLVQAHHHQEAMKAIYSNISDLNDNMVNRLEDMEKALTRLAVSCGGALPDDDGGDESARESPEDMVKRHIRKYDSDKTGMIDWAMESLGGSVVTTRGTESYVLGATAVLGVPCSKWSSDPASIIRPSTTPGSCWAFKGEGTVVVKLAAPVYVGNFSLEHVPKEMTPHGEATSAPKIFRVWGVADSHQGLRHDFGHFEYRSSGEPLQTYAVRNPSYTAFELVEFNFKTNHGNKDFTCVYRIRVHGSLTIDSAPA